MMYIDPTGTKTVHLTSTRIHLDETASESGTFLTTIFALGALITVGLCILAGVVFCCMFKLILRKRKGKKGSAAVTVSPKEEHYEVIDPIYEIINTDTDNLSSGTQITMDNNDAYKPIKSMGKTYPSEGIDVANNEAYIQITTELPMEHNSSYRAAPFSFQQECYDKQSVYNLKHIQQKKSCTDTSMSQNDKITKFQNQNPALYVKGVNMNI